MFSLPRAALIAVAGATVLRLIVAFRVPLNADEAYYWSWSRHLDFGYVDHPPAVAWLIALTSPLGRSPGVVRLPFVVCEALTALLLGRAARSLARSDAAGTAAALAFTLLPEMKLAIGEARPDAPFLLFWALALCSVAEMTERASLRGSLLLGIALGGALLSRFFGWALLLGLLAYVAPRQKASLRRGVFAACLVAFALYAPFVAWNAAHGWANFGFTVHGRQRYNAFSLGRLSIFSTARFLVFMIPFWFAAWCTAIRPRRPLVAWTALPLPLGLVLLTPFQKVEAYWILGPYASLCLGLGASFAAAGAGRRRAVAAFAALPALATMAAALFLALPEAMQATAFRYVPAARAPLGSSSFEYGPLAADVRRTAAARSAPVLSDIIWVGAPLYHQGVPSVMIGQSAQAPMWDAWSDVRSFERAAPWALLVRSDPIAADPRLRVLLYEGCAGVAAGPIFRYRFAGTGERPFYSYWCRRPDFARLAS